MTLCTLPKELGRRIVDSLAEDYDGPNAKIRGLHNLSATSSSLNSFCGHIIFHTYYLDIRPLTDVAYPKGSANKSWNIDAIRARLALLQTKSAFVRELHVSDHWDFDNGSHPTDLELLETLRTLRALTSIHLTTYRLPIGFNARIHPDLWKWIVDVKPRTLSLEGFFEIPHGEIFQPIENLDTLKLHSCTNDTKALIDLHKPRHISLTYTSVPFADKEDCFPYKPNHENLESVDIEFEITGRLKALAKEPLFDFSRVPQASIKVKVTDISHHFTKYAYITRLLQRMFVEDLSGYDVRQIATYAEVTQSPLEGWKPQFQDHLPANELSVEFFEMNRNVSVP